MDIINQIVIHESCGEGTIIEKQNEYIIVRFSQEVKKFQFPTSFRTFLKMKDPEFAAYTASLISEQDKAEEEKKERALRQAAQQEELKKKRQSEIQEKSRKKSTVTPQNTGKKKTDVRQNIAFKCNFCDGGKSAYQVGFQGACSDSVIYNNIIKEKREWCNNESCPCLKYYYGEIDRAVLDRYDEFVCYESVMLRDWRALAGRDNDNTSKRIKNAQMNKLCVLTTRDPDSIEEKRYIFAVYLIDEVFQGDAIDEGYVAADSKFRIKLSPEEAHKLPFWNYHANGNSSEITHWGTGLFRYYDDTTAVQILRDIAEVKVGTADEQLAKEFLNHYCRVNGVDLNEVPPKSGALLRGKRKILY